MSSDLRTTNKYDLTNFEACQDPATSPVGQQTTFSVALAHIQHQFSLGEIRDNRFYKHADINTARVSLSTPLQEFPHIVGQINIATQSEPTLAPLEADSILCRAEVVSDPDLKALLLYRVVFLKLETARQQHDNGHKALAKSLCDEAFSIAKHISIEAFKNSSLYRTAEQFFILRDYPSITQIAFHISDPNIRAEVTARIPPPSPSLWEQIRNNLYSSSK